MPALLTDDAVFFEVATLTVPSDTPFIVVRMDTREREDGGIPATVISQHRDKAEADKEAARLAGRLN